MNFLLIDNHSKLVSSLEDILNRFGNCTICSRENIIDPARYNAIVLSGGSDFSVTEFPEKYAQEIALLSQANVPVIGICLGCEVIAHAYGCKLNRVDEKIIGVKEIAITSDHPLFDSAKKVIPVYKSHRWVISELGPEVESLAHSETGHEIIKVRGKEIWGFQFHPEKVIDQQGDEVLTNLLRLLAKE